MEDMQDMNIGPDRNESWRLGFEEGVAQGRNIQLKDMIRRKIQKGKTSQEIAEELDEDIMDIEMLIVQIIERC